MEIVQSREYILIRLSIMEKVKQLLSAFVPVIDEKVIRRLPAQVQSELIHAKLSKGENYLQLPYMVLDHPRHFDGGNIFTVRTMFWWSEFISITLHLSGKHLELFRVNIAEGYKKCKRYFICIQKDQWQHHFSADNYVPVSSIKENDWSTLVQNADFLKIAIYFNLTLWEDLPELTEKVYSEIADLLI